MVSETFYPFLKIIEGITLFQTKCIKTGTLETKKVIKRAVPTNKTKQTKAKQLLVSIKWIILVKL